MTSSFFPALNAALNALAAFFILTGFLFIKRGKIELHGIVMRLAFITSSLFLASYLYYHTHFQPTRFHGIGWVRGLYFTILISHTLLAVIIVPLVLRTLYLAVRCRFVEHRQIAKWTFPIWLYVSVTGVIVYCMLYRMEWS